MCTSVAAMGCHTGGLNLGISLGAVFEYARIVSNATRMVTRSGQQHLDHGPTGGESWEEGGGAGGVHHCGGDQL